MDVYLDWHLITPLHGNNVIGSVPIGRKVYATAAQASVIMPTCPHSRSFQPTAVPTGNELKNMLSLETRNTRWASFN